MATTDDDRAEFVQSLDRGLAVIRCFNSANPQMTIADVARMTGLTRAASRRFLHTLQALGYVGSEDGRFHLRARVLELGYAYLSSMSVAEVAQQHLVALAKDLHESCSASVLDFPDIVYIARAQTSRIMTIALSVGTRLPAYATSMGRVLLAAMPDDEVAALLRDQEMPPLTNRTVHRADELLTELHKVRDAGYALVDQELELGLRSISVPLHDATGAVVAAANVSAHASRVSAETLESTFLARLRQTGTEIDGDLRSRS